MKKLVHALLLSAAITSCARNEPPGGSPKPAASAEVVNRGNVVARVNGAPITDLDVDLKLQNDSHEAAPGDARRKAVLEQLIGKELMAQKALENGLDADPKYKEGLRRMMAQVEAYKRQELAELYLRREGEKRTTFTEDELRAHYQKNEKRIRTEVHVLQILRRSEAAIIEARSMIDRGKSFEEAAKDLFPNLPEGQKPWDLGWLSFQKVPEPWRETIDDMKPGEMSGVLRGPNERFWLIKLVEVRENDKIDFESVKDALAADMKATGVQRSREGLNKELRAGAKIEMLAP